MKDNTLREKVVALNKGLANHYANDDVFAGFGDVSPITHNKAILSLIQSEVDKAIAEEVRKARVDELDNLIGTYNNLFEPNGEFKPFGTLSKMDIANLYSAIGQRIRELEKEGK